jgi:tRNA(Ile)-lysidine synthase
LADILRTEETWIDGLVTDPYRKARLHRHATCITLSAGRISQAHPALARRLIRKALQELCGSLRRITFCHLQSVLNLLAHDGAEKSAASAQRYSGPPQRRSPDDLFIEPGRRGRAEATFQKPAPANREIPTPLPASIEIAAMGFELRFSLCRPRHLPPWGDVGADRAYVDLDRLNLPLTVRPAAAGDRFTPLGAAGSQKLKKFFIDHHISRQARANAPVLTDQHGLVWLIGQRIDERVKVTLRPPGPWGLNFSCLTPDDG